MMLPPGSDTTGGNLSRPIRSIHEVPCDTCLQRSRVATFGREAIEHAPCRGMSVGRPTRSGGATSEPRTDVIAREPGVILMRRGRLMSVGKLLILGGIVLVAV